MNKNINSCNHKANRGATPDQIDKKSNQTKLK